MITATRVMRIAAAVLACGCASSGLTINVEQVTGFADEASSTWMPLRVTIALTNNGPRTAITHVHVEPDFEGFNEAYGLGTPRDLDTPLPIGAGARASYQAVVTLLNAQQLQPGMHDLMLKVSVQTADGGEISTEVPAQFRQAASPSGRTLTLASPR